MNAVWRTPPGTSCCDDDCISILFFSFKVSEGWRLVNALAKNPIR